jgi:hypothetical protein
MSCKFTYSGDPARNDNDATRFLLGDTDPEDFLLQDKEIAWLVSEHGSPRSAAIHGAEGIAAKFSRLADEKVGQVSVNYKQLSENYQRLADRLRKNRDISISAPIVGGISKSDKESVADNSDRVSPKFTKDLHEGSASFADDTGCLRHCT